MPNTKTTNEVPNLSAEDTQSKTYGSAEILSENTVIVFLAAIILMGAAVLFWTLEVGPDISGIYIGICTTTILALILGYRAQSLGARPFRAAYGVAWRIGAAWVVLAAIAEFATTDLTATFNRERISGDIHTYRGHCRAYTSDRVRAGYRLAQGDLGSHTPRYLAHSRDFDCGCRSIGYSAK